MLRKLFGSTMAVSMIGAVIIGGAAAWTSSTTPSSQSAQIGGISVALANPGSTGNYLYPTGQFIAVLQGNIQNNTPANPGVAVVITGGAASSFNPGGCVTSQQVAVTDPSPVPPGGNVGGIWRLDLAMPTNADNSCQNQTLTYDLVINVATQ